MIDRDNIVRMAREAGFNWPDIQTTTIEERLERFAALVEAAERKQCALTAWEIVQYEVHADLADKVAQAILERSNT